MKPTNRLHSLTRWPSDPRRRLELAETDISFADALRKIVGKRMPEIDRIAICAFDVKFAAQDQLRKEQC